MKPKILKKIKDEIRLFYSVFEALIEYMNKDSENPIYTACLVLIQNAQFNGIECVNYSHEKAEENIHKIVDVLYKMSEYHSQNWIVKYAYEELRDIVQMNIMCESN